MIRRKQRKLIELLVVGLKAIETKLAYVEQQTGVTTTEILHFNLVTQNEKEA
jgi:hypothetical protein